jgi:hypothetical protein
MLLQNFAADQLAARAQEYIMPQGNVRIDSALIDQVRKVSETTGVPISRCVSDAVSTWLQVTAPVWLKVRKLPKTDRRHRQGSQPRKRSRSLSTARRKSSATKPGLPSTSR